MSDPALDSKRTLLAVLAHPDDESFGMGGTLALYARQGVDVYLVCATRGEAGEVAPEMLEGYASIADRRVAELGCAANILGLKNVYFLNYRDSGMEGSPDNQNPRSLYAAPLDEVAARVTHYIRLLRPQVVLTFDPIGGYRHPDHIKIQQAAVRAFEAAGDSQMFPDPDGLPTYQPQKLYFHTMSRRFLRIAVRVLRFFGQDPAHWGRNKDIDLTAVAVQDFPVHAEIDYGAVAKVRLEAAACHASQGGPAITGGAIGLINRILGQKEYFMQAYPPVVTPYGRRATDLFEDVH